MRLLLAALLSSFLLAASAKTAPFEVLKLDKVIYHCTSLESLSAWLEAGNKDGLMALMRASEFEGCAIDPLPVRDMKPIAFVRGFGIPLVIIVAQTSKGEVFSFVAASTIPVVPGVEA